MRVAAIDPGMDGAVAFLIGDTLSVVDMPVAGKYVMGSMLADWMEPARPELVVIEEVHSMPKQGVATTFKFGAAFGVVLGVVGALRLPMVLVRPTTWKRDMGLGPDKERSRQRAIETWPWMADSFARKKDHGRAEAALLAKWGRDHETSAPVVPPAIPS